MRKFLLVLILLVVVGVAVYYIWFRGPQPGTVQDEAMAHGRTAESFPAADEDYFHAMDRGQNLSVSEIKGRNNWIVWTGGNDRFWDYLAINSTGALDFLKTVSSHTSLPFNRDNRFNTL